MRRVSFVVALALTLSAETITIQKGWNLFGAPTDIELSKFDNSCVDYVWKYNSSINDGKLGWQIYLANRVDYSYSGVDLKALKKWDGFWLKARDGCEVKINDVSLTPINPDTPFIKTTQFDTNETNIEITKLESTKENTIYKIVGGDDYRYFQLNENGYLNFKEEFDFETPKDSNKDNIYNILIEASANNLTSKNSINISLKDINGFGIVSKFYTEIRNNENANWTDGLYTPVVEGGTLSSKEQITGEVTLPDNSIKNINFNLNSGVAPLYAIKLPNADTGIHKVKITIKDGSKTATQEFNYIVVEENSYSIPNGSDFSVNVQKDKLTKIDFQTKLNLKKTYFYEITEQPKNGTLIQKRDGTWWFKGNIDDTFKYKISYLTNKSTFSEKRVTITMGGTN